MKVQLINVAEYDIKDGKTTDIPFGTFVNLCGNVGQDPTTPLPKVRLFKSMDEFRNLTIQEMETLEQEESVKVLPNGQFLVFLRGKDKKETIKRIEDNATANTEKD